MRFLAYVAAVASASFGIGGTEIVAQQKALTDVRGSVGRTQRDTVPLIMSVSGAISVGSYQAGVNWFILDFLRRARDDPQFDRREWMQGLPVFDLRTVTGASAGNINALLWAIEWCTSDRSPQGGSPVARPDSSLFWKMWVGIGLNSMLPVGPYNAGTMERAILERSAIRRMTDSLILTRLRSPKLIAKCSVPIGITLTRTRPDVINYQGLEIETQRFATLFKASVVDDTLVERDGDRMHFLQLDTPPEGESHFGKLVRLLPQNARIGTDQVLQAVQASAAFPIALAPVSLKVWYPDARGEGHRAESVFIDGGVFDNNPLNLALGLFHHVYSSTPSARVVYINPFRYRAELEWKRRATNEAATVSAGVAGFTDFLGGAIATGRQYELQLLARERRIDSVLAQRFAASVDSIGARLAGVPGVDSARLSAIRRELSAAIPAAAARRDSFTFTSRAYPIYGEHLNAFAGFLGRPLREFDFFAGMYDGMDYVAREFVCGKLVSAARILSCVRRTMADLIRDEQMVPPFARRLLAALYDREHFPDRGLSDRLALSADIRPPGEPDEAEKDRMLLALYRGAISQLSTVSPDDCRSALNSVHLALCRDGLGLMLDRFVADTETNKASPSGESVIAILKKWERQCAGEALVECRAEPDFVRLVTDQAKFAPLLLERVLTRTEDVERSLKHDGQANHAGLITAVNALYHTTTMRSRTRFETSPSLPSDAALPWRFFPYSVGGPVGRSGWEVRFRPTFNCGCGPIDAVTFPMTWLNDEERRLNKLSADALAVGVGTAWRAPIPAAGLFFNEAGAEMHWLMPGAHADSAWAASEVYGTFIGGFLRVSVRLDTHRFLREPRFISTTFSLSDLGGLAYWIMRSAR